VGAVLYLGLVVRWLRLPIRFDHASSLFWGMFSMLSERSCYPPNTLILHPRPS